MVEKTIRIECDENYQKVPITTLSGKNNLAAGI